jgi:hypothetical protein
MRIKEFAGALVTGMCIAHTPEPKEFPGINFVTENYCNSKGIPSPFKSEKRKQVLREKLDNARNDLKRTVDKYYTSQGDIVFETAANRTARNCSKLIKKIADIYCPEPSKSI